MFLLQVTLHFAENDDISVRCRLQDVIRISDIEFDLLLALTTCKERDALHQQAKILREAVKLVEMWTPTTGDLLDGSTLLRVDVVDEKGESFPGYL